MPTLSQKNKPLLFLLQGGDGPPIPFVFGVPIIGAIRPEHYAFTRTSRGTVTHTVGSAWVDDFGEGPGQLLIAGHTGWGTDLEVPGILKMKALEAVFVETLARRQRMRLASQDPNDVQFWLLDELNMEALSLYPLEFTLEKTRARPLLYFYRMRFIVAADLLQQAVYSAGDTIQSTLNNVGAALTSLGESFGLAA